MAITVNEVEKLRNIKDSVRALCQNQFHDVGLVALMIAYQMQQDLVIDMADSNSIELDHRNVARIDTELAKEYFVDLVRDLMEDAELRYANKGLVLSNMFKFKRITPAVYAPL